MNVQRIGNSAPLHSTAAGKLFLTNYPTPQLEKLIEQHPLEKYTDTTIVSFNSLLEELDKIRQDGYPIDDGENEAGIKCIAYPIFNKSGKVAASISITGPSFRLSEEWNDDKQEYLANAARQLTEQYQKIGNFNI